jgi:cytochrome P450
MIESLIQFFSSGEVVFATVLCIVLSRFLYRRKSDIIPLATGSVPLFGHALTYKDDPATFLSSQSLGVFRINLMGREMIVIRDERAMKQVATMSEGTMSARRAVADIGFEYTLGHANVYKGTDWHKRILKDYIYNKDNNVYPEIWKHLVEAFDYEASAKSHDDLFVLMRRCMLRAMMTYMIAPNILRGENIKFLDEFMDYQDCVEDATAKAAILPRLVSVPIVLRPVQQQRQELTTQLAHMIEELYNNNDEIVGPWLTAFQKNDITAEEAAELTIGLMFAAHKNPAIGVSQSFCYLQTEATKEQQERAMQEATKIYQCHRSGKTLMLPLNSSPTLRACVLETLRLTAHSIGGIRTAQTDFILETSSGITHSIQKGDVIAICHVGTHRDESVWGKNACNYQQDRWITTIPVDGYKYTTFSHGVHKCPGESLAISMMEMMLSILLVRGVKLVDSKETLAKVSFKRATLAQRDGPVPIVNDSTA